MTGSETLPKAPLVQHLAEFRKRFMRALIVYLLAVGLAYGFAEQIYGFLVSPLAGSFEHPESKRLIYTGLAEAFLTYIRLAMFAGLFLAFPAIAYQFYCYIAPGLYKRERHVLVPYLVISPVLFVAGAALAYFYIIPLAWKFFVSFESVSAPGGLPIQLEARVSEYLSLVMQLIVVFGLSFQLPVVLTLLARAGLVHAGTLARGRRYAAVIIVTVAAFVTPPDVFSQIALSIPLYLLYEVSIFSCRMMEKRNDARSEIHP